MTTKNQTPIQEDERLRIFDELHKRKFTIRRVADILKRSDTALSNIKIGRANFNPKIKAELLALIDAVKELDEAPNTKEINEILGKKIEEKVSVSNVKTTYKSRVLEERIIRLEAIIEEKEKQIENLSSIIKLLSNNLK